MSEKPTAAFILVLIGGVLIFLNGLILLALSTIAAAIAATIVPLPHIATLIIALGSIGLIFGILLIIASIKINSGNPSMVRTWSIVALILSILSLFLCNGFIIGFILALVGAILGLIWKPPSAITATLT